MTLIVFGLNKCYEQLSSITTFFSPVKISTWVLNTICQHELFIYCCIKFSNSYCTSGQISKRVHNIHPICALWQMISLLNYHLCFSILVSNDSGMHGIKYMKAKSEYHWSLICEVRVHANAALLFCFHKWRYVVIS